MVMLLGPDECHQPKYQGQRARKDKRQRANFNAFDLHAAWASNWGMGDVNMTIKHAAIITVSAIAALCALWEIPAHARGSGVGLHRAFPFFHAFHFGKHFRNARFNRNLNDFPSYGGLYALPPYDYNYGYNSDSGAQPANFVYVVESPRVRSCQYIRETVTVPSESGGTRDITVTRC
jgi:hypothetical protein